MASLLGDDLLKPVEGNSIELFGWEVVWVCNGVHNEPFFAILQPTVKDLDLPARAIRSMAR